MPEITSRDAVLAKLREFDEKMDGAIEAATTIVKTKDDAQKLGHELLAAADKSKSKLAEIEEVHEEWGQLKKAITDSQTQTAIVRNQIIHELDAFQNQLQALVLAAAENLRSELQDSLEDSSQYTAKAKEYAENTTAEKAACENIHTRVKQLLDAAKNKYQFDFIEKYRSLLDEVGKHADLVTQSNQKTIETFQQESLARQEELQLRLKEDAERQLTDFLSKQNVLVQNFGQQVDGFQRLLNVQKEKLDQTSKILNELEKKALSAFSGYSQMLIKQEGEIKLLQERDSQLTKLTDRFEKVLDMLQNTKLIGSKFKGI